MGWPAAKQPLKIMEPYRGYGKGILDKTSKSLGSNTKYNSFQNLIKILYAPILITDSSGSQIPYYSDAKQSCASLFMGKSSRR